MRLTASTNLPRGSSPISSAAQSDDHDLQSRRRWCHAYTALALKIKGFGYDYHKIKTYESVPAKVTGIMIVDGHLRVPHSRLRKIRETRLMLESATGQDRAKLLASLVGRLSEAEHIEPRLRSQRDRILQKYGDEWSEVVAARARKAAAAAKRRQQQYASAVAAAKKPSLPS